MPLPQPPECWDPRVHHYASVDEVPNQLFSLSHSIPGSQSLLLQHQALVTLEDSPLTLPISELTSQPPRLPPLVLFYMNEHPCISKTILHWIKY